MALKRVAVDGDANASAGSKNFVDTATGSWTAGPVTVSAYDQLSAGGTKVIYKAECSFTYQGSDNSSGATVPGESSVTLEASGTTLQGGDTFVLVDGDSAEDEFGNKIEVSASSPLQADQ